MESGTKPIQEKAASGSSIYLFEVLWIQSHIYTGCTVPSSANGVRFKASSEVQLEDQVKKTLYITQEFITVKFTLENEPRTLLPY